MTSADAKALAAIQHAGQVDKAGLPYIEHVERVAARAEGRAIWARQHGLAIDVDHTVQAAWLHDVVEDTPVEVEDLVHQGFALEVVAMVELLTKPAGPGSYLEKLGRLLRAGNLGALLVKLADNEDNTNRTRGFWDTQMQVRYAAAKTLLLRAAGDLGYVEL